MCILKLWINLLGIDFRPFFVVLIRKQFIIQRIFSITITTMWNLNQIEHVEATTSNNENSLLLMREFPSKMHSKAMKNYGENNIMEVRFGVFVNKKSINFFVIESQFYPHSDHVRLTLHTKYRSSMILIFYMLFIVSIILSLLNRAFS